MTNLVISAVCNRRCAYCFTVDRPAPARRFLPLADFQERLDFLGRSGVERVRLLGGEPTLHPRFAELVARARETGKPVTVFTNGLMPAAALASLEALSPQECTVVVNVQEPAVGRGNGTLERQRQVLRRLGKRAMPGFNLYRTNLTGSFVLDLVAETGCRPAVRLSMAHPALSGRNQFIHPTQYRAVAARIVDLARAGLSAGVRLEFDCGFVRCMFSQAEIDLLREAKTDLGWRCNPILDVDIDGQVVHCFPLAGLLRLPLPATEDAATLRARFEAHTRHYRQAGVFRHCSTCGFKEAGECPGGCLAATIRRFRSTPFSLAVPRGAEVRQ